MSYPPHLRHIFRHDREVLVQGQRVQIQRVKRICRRTVSLAPFAGFCCAEVVRCVDVAGAPVTFLEAFRGASVPIGLLVASEGCTLGLGDLAGLRDGWDCDGN